MTCVDARDLPEHIGIIMDGNGRWAVSRGMPREEGHRVGSQAVRRIVRASRRLGLRVLTLYAFSEQNWDRPNDEVSALMGLLREYLLTEREEILQNGIRLAAIGDLSRLPPAVREVLDPLRAASDENDGMTLVLALSYGGREEIAAVTRDLAREAAEGTIDPTSIDIELIRSRLPSTCLMEPDLIVRTGGDQRISNFMLFGAPNAELAFVDRLWPDFEEEDLFAVIASYQTRRRDAREPRGA